MRIDKLVFDEILVRLESADQLRTLFEFYVRQLEEHESGSLATRSFTEWEIFKAIDPEKYNREWKRQLGSEPTAESKIPERSSARPANNRLRDVLQRFAVSPTGRKLPQQLSIPLNKFLLQVKPTDPHVKRFWSPYISSEEAKQPLVRIMYTEHLFYYHREKKYVVRHLEANDERTNIRRWLPFIPEEDGELTPAHHFVNAGDVQAVLQFSNLFNELSIPVAYSHAKAGREPEQIPSGNLVILGSPRTSPLVEVLQDEFDLNFRHSSDSYAIANRAPKDGEDAEYPSEPRTTNALYGVLSRFYSEPLDAWVTMVVSSHGRFFAAMSHYLRDDRGAKELADSFRITADGAFPSRFEVLLSLVPPRVDKRIMRGYRPSIVAHRLKV